MTQWHRFRRGGTLAVRIYIPIHYHPCSGIEGPHSQEELYVSIQLCSLLNRGYIKSIEKIILDFYPAATPCQHDKVDNLLLGYTWLF